MKKKIYLLILLIVLAAIAYMMPGCKKEPTQLSSYHPIDNTKSDTLRIYNLLPDSSIYNSNGYVLYLNDSIRHYMGVTSAGYGTTYGAPPAVALPAQGGTFTVKLIQYNYYGAVKPPNRLLDTETVVIQKTFTVPPHSGYSNMIFYDDNGKPAVQYYPVTAADPGAPSPGKFKVRLINFGYAMTDNGPSYPENSAGAKYAMQMQYADSTTVQGNDNIPFGGMGQYQEQDYGTVQFLIRNLTLGNYVTNSGPLNDVTATYNLEGLISYPGNYSNSLFPNVGTYMQYSNLSTVNYGNIGSYPFSAGGCYTILVIGNIYSVSLDRQYEPGTMDNYGKVQVVNANPNQQDMSVKINYSGSEKDIASLPFGQSTDPLTVPAGDVSFTFSSQGKTLYTYNVQVPRLTNYTYYYTSDLQGIPFVFPEVVAINAKDYQAGSFSSPPVLQYCKMSALDLCADAGAVFFTQQSNLTGGLDVKMFGNNPDMLYKQENGGNIYDGTVPPTAFSLRLSATRKDSLAAQKVAALSPPFKVLPAPGTYTLAAMGLLNTTDPAKKIRLVMVKHTNIISKTN